MMIGNVDQQYRITRCTCLIRPGIQMALIAMLVLMLFTQNKLAAAAQTTQIVLKTDIPEDPYQDDGISFRALCYHDVRDNLRDTMKDWPQMGALDTYDLMQQFSWLRENGYHPVSLDAIIAARNNGPKLPPKAVLLTFDDGYLSVYTRVFPLLKLYRYPAVIGLVGKWLEETENSQVYYGDQWVSRDHFVTWPQVREMQASGLVEIASHSYALHQGETANPQGGKPPSAITRIFDPKLMRYETEQEYYQRIRSDLKRNSKMIAKHTGKEPRSMIWPYGAYNMTTVRAANEVGMPITMTLEAGANSPEHPMTRIRRDMLFFHEKITDLKRNLRQPSEYEGAELPLNRVVGVNLDELYHPDPVIQDANVGILVERILRLRVNMVYLLASADLNNNNKADALYFPNRHLPMRADLLNRVAWQLRTRGALPPNYIRVYVALPVTAFDLPEPNQEKIKAIYEDAAKNAPRVAGIVFNDDTAAKNPGIEFAHTSTRHKIATEEQALENFIEDLAITFRLHQPHALTVRKVSAAMLAEPYSGSDNKFSNIIQTYDYVIVSVTSDAASGVINNSLSSLFDRVLTFPGAVKKTIMELPTATQKSRKPVPAILLANGFRQLQLQGARNFGYFPDVVLEDHPALEILRPTLSLKSNPSPKR